MDTQNPVKDNSCNRECRGIRGCDDTFPRSDDTVDTFPIKCNVCNRELSGSADLEIHTIYHESQNNECLFTCSSRKKSFSNATDFNVYHDTVDAINPTAADEPRQSNRANHKLNTNIDKNPRHNSDSEFLRQTNMNYTGTNNSIHAPSTNSTTPRIRKTPTKRSCCDPKPAKQTRSRQVRQAHNHRKSNMRDKTKSAFNANKQTEKSQPCTLLNLQAAEQNRETEIRSENAATQSTIYVSQSLKAMADKKPTQSKETINSRTDTEITLSTNSIGCRRFSMKRKWNKHNLNHTSLNVYSCESCNQSFPTLFNFKLRLKRVGRGSSAQIWKICDQSFKGSCHCPKQKQQPTENDIKSKRNASQNPSVVAMETGSKMESDTRVEMPNLQSTLIPNKTDNAPINNIDNSMCLDSTPQGANVCNMQTQCTTTDVRKDTERSLHTSPFFEVIHVLQEPTECETPNVRSDLESSSSQVIDVFDKATECKTASQRTREQSSKCNTETVIETSPLLPVPSVLDEKTDKENRIRQLSSNCNIAVEKGTNNRTVIASNCNNSIETMPSTSSTNSSTELHHGPEVIDLTSCDTDDEDQLCHELEATEPTGVTYICFKCHKEFEMPWQLLEHVDNVHSRHEN